MKKITSILIISCMLVSLSLTGCSEFSKSVNHTIYDVDPDEYSGMRDGGEYYDPALSSEDFGSYGLVENDPVKAEADGKKRAEVASEQAIEASKKAAEVASRAAEESSKAAEEASKAAEASKSAANGGSSTISGSGNSLTGANNVQEKGNLGEVRTIIRGKDTSKYSSNGSSSGGNTNSDISKKNVASIKKSGTLYDSYITIENAYRGSQAVRRLNTYNSHHAVEYNMDVPDGYEICIVSFTVEPSSKLGSKSDGVYIPKTRIKQGSGSSFGKHAIIGHVIQLSDIDYDEEDDDSKNNKNSTKTYDLVFEIPDDTDTYSVIFGDPSGSTYRFKSTSLD